MIDPKNYIPGCASYTKASEISSLQKYLKKGIKKRDEALELPDSPDEIKRDPRIPGVTELPKKAVSLHDPRKVTQLPDKSLKIINPREEALETHLEKITPAEDPRLPNTAVGLTDNRETALESRRENISVPETDSLENHREELTGTQEISELPKTRLDINDTLVPELPKEAVQAPGEIKEPESLENTRIGIEGEVPKTESLSDSRIETPGSETQNEISSLPKTAVKGPKPTKVTLEKHREEITDKNKVTLETHREELEDRRKITLEDHREEIEDRRNLALETHKEALEDKRDPSLETHRENLEDKRNIALDKHRENLEDKRNVALDKHRENLEDKRNVTLDKHRENLEDKRNPTLDKTQVKTPGKQKSPELSGTVINGPKVKNVGLEKEKIGLTDKRKVTLENHRENIKNKKNPKLSDHVEKITNKKDPELPGTIIGLTDKRNVELENHKETIEDPRTTELPETRENIKVPGTPELPTDSVSLKAGPGVDLEDHSEKLEGVAEIQELPGDLQNIPGEIQETTLPGSSVKMPGEIKEPELPDTKITRPGADKEIELPVDTDKLKGVTAIDSLETTRLDLEDDRETILPEGRLDLTDEREIILPEGRLDLTDEREVTLPEGALPIEGEIPEIGSLGNTVIKRPGESPDLDQIYSETENGGLYPIEAVDVTLPDTRIDIVDNNEPFLEDEKLPMEPNATKPGWNGELVDINDIKSEPNDNWTVEPDQNPEGWDGTLEDTVIPSEPNMSSPGWDGTLEDEQIKAGPDENPVGWNGSLENTVISDDGDQNPEGWGGSLEDTVIPGEPDENPIGWDESLEDEQIKAGPDENPEGWNESLEDERLDLTDINDILGLETETLRMPRPGSVESMDPDHAYKFVDASYNHDFDRDNPDGISSTITSEFSDGVTSSLEQYGKETETPDMMKVSQPNEAIPNPWPTGTDLNYVDTRKEKDLKGYGEETKDPVEIAPYKSERSMDPDHAQRFVDISYNHSFDKKSNGTSSSIESDFSNGSVASLFLYGKETEDPVDILPSQGISIPTKANPEADYDELKEAFNWSAHNMGKRDDLSIPPYKLGGGGSFMSYLNPSKYLRWLVENTVGMIPASGSTKQWLLDQALAGLITARDLLEEAANLHRHRLPGSSEYLIRTARDAVDGDGINLLDTAVGAAANLLSSETIAIKNPINRPEKENKSKTRKQEYSWEAMEKFESKDGQNAADSHLKENTSKDKNDSFIKKAAEKVSKALGSNYGLSDYYPTYFRDLGEQNASCQTEEFGMKGTLWNLAKIEDKKSIKTFDELKDILENSPYTTTSTKLYGPASRSIHRHDTALTLDSNHIWEIIFEPYLGVENGNKSYLPSIQQINYENFHGFGINTNWRYWIPFTSFELNSKKMVQKNLGLYSGEISIPQNLEFTNELRLVICDDQYKSWKRYFDMVMYASTYLSEIHDRDYYKKEIIKDIANNINGFTANDIQHYYKGVVRPAPYKNLTFRCKILSMNPQFQTINVSDLLVVLKDFTEEWQGEIDASPTELALMFSVVGENPKAKLISTEINEDEIEAKKIKEVVDQTISYLQVKYGKVIKV